MQRISAQPPGLQGSSGGRKRRLPLRAALSLAGGVLVASPLVVAQPLARSASLFEARPVDEARFAVLGRPLREGDWSLVLLEQIQAGGPPCWRMRADGLVDPTLNRFDFTGICGRYVDSNGFSLRLADVDAGEIPAGGLQLRLQQIGGELQLQAASPDLAQVLVVGRATVPRIDRHAFVALRLEPGWQLQRRVYGGQSLNHIYVSNGASLDTLLARAAQAPAAALAAPQARALASRPRLRLTQLPPPPPPTPELPLVSPQGGSGRAIALQVIPFQE